MANTSGRRAAEACMRSPFLSLTPKRQRLPSTIAVWTAPALARPLARNCPISRSASSQTHPQPPSQCKPHRRLSTSIHSSQPSPSQLPKTRQQQSAEPQYRSWDSSAMPSAAYRSVQPPPPPPPPVLGSRPLFYLAQRFPVLAESELMAIPNRTALDYSSFLIGAMSISYPSAPTLRAVIRQFRNFLKASGATTAKVGARAGSAGARAQGITGGSAGTTLEDTVNHELPQARIWTQAIRSMIWLKQYRKARVAIHAMRRLGIKPSGFAWRAICRGWIQQGQIKRAEELAAKVFSDPSISQPHKLEERPYVYADMMNQNGHGNKNNINNSGSHGSGGDRRKRYRHRSPMSPNSAPLFLVIEALTEQGDMERARYWFDQIPEYEMTDMLTSDMVSGYLKTGQEDKAEEVIQIMARCGIKPTAIVFNPVMEYAVENNAMEHAEQLMKEMADRGVFVNLYTFKILIRGYMARGNLERTLQLLDQIKELGIPTDRALGRIVLEGLYRIGESRQGDIRPPLVSDRIRPRGVIGDGDGNDSDDDSDEQAEDMMGGMGRIKWDHERCIQQIRRGEFDVAEDMMRYVTESKLMVTGQHREQTLAEFSSAIKALIDKKEMSRARHWFDPLIALATKEVTGSDDHDATTATTAKQLFKDMMAGYVKTRQQDQAEDMIQDLASKGFYPTVDIYNMMLDWYTQQDDLSIAESVFERMEATDSIGINLRSVEVMALGFAAHGQLEKLTELLEGQKVKAAKSTAPGFKTEGVVLSALEHSLLESGRQKAADGFDQSEHETRLFTELCQRWVDQRRYQKAEEFVESLVENPLVNRTSVPWHVIIGAWVEQSQQSINKNASSPSSSSSSPSSTTTVDHSRVFGQHAAARSSSMHEAESKARMIHMNAMKKARQWFDRVPDESLTLSMCNQMIQGYMKLGMNTEGEAMILLMAEKGIRPNVGSYNSMLEFMVMTKQDDSMMMAAEDLMFKMQTKIMGVSPDLESWNILIRGYVLRGRLSDALRCVDRMTRGERRRQAGQRQSQRQSLVGKVMDGQQQQQSATDVATASVASASVVSAIEPNWETEQLILSGFGFEQRPVQGQGDYGRALAVYQSRLERQRQQEEAVVRYKEQLQQQHQQSGNLERSRGSSSSSASASALPLPIPAELLKTDLDWKDELKWEELKESEREQAREQLGRSVWW